MAIGLLGDVMLGRGVADVLRQSSPETLWDPRLRELAASLDLVVCNLECCISARGEPTTRIQGKPFFFRGPPAAAGALEAMSVRAVSLANNHALDFEEEALADTIALLHDRGIATAGGGLGPSAARAPAIVHAGGARVGLVAVTDHPREYAVAAERWGVAHGLLREGPPDWLLEQVALTRRQCDLVIAFPHWGPNMTTGPASWQRELARRLRQAGADIVAGHSAHVFHGVGWTDGPMLFDLGGAIDDYMTDPRLRNDLGVLAIWRPWSRPQLELVGLRLEYAYTRMAEGADADWIAARLDLACRELGTTATRTDEQRFAIEPAGRAASDA